MAQNGLMKAWLGAWKGLSVAAVLCLLSSCSSGGLAQSSSICVTPGGGNGCYATISIALSQATSGQTIIVNPGRYKEMAVVTKSVMLVGSSDPNSPSIIDASGLSHGIYVDGVTSGPVAVENFVVENANHEGILVENSSQVTIQNNLVQNNDLGLILSGSGCGTGTPPCCPGAFPFDQEDCGEAIHLRGVTFSSVLNNTVTNNRGGILLTDETGPTSNNVIGQNTVKGNPTDCGITLPSHPKCGANSSDMTGCIGGPEIGKPAYGVFDNIVVHNLSDGNGASGTGVFAPTPGTMAYGNTIADNILTNNGAGGVVLHSHNAGQNLNNNVIEGNIISGNGPDPDSEGGNTAPVGIVIFSDGSAQTPGGMPAPAAPLQGINVTRNLISNEGIDVWVGNDTATNVTLSYNDLSGPNTVVGVMNAGNGTVGAMANYWDCSEGPGANPMCSTTNGTVLTIPPLPNAVNVDDAGPSITSDSN